MTHPLIEDNKIIAWHKVEFKFRIQKCYCQSVTLYKIKKKVFWLCKTCNMKFEYEKGDIF